MNDDVRLERLIADGLHELAPRRAPDRLRTQVKAETGESRPRARWLALIKESPMRSNSRLAVGSPTARVAAIMAATLLAALLVVSAGVAGAQLFAASGPIVVDQAGGGDFTTIAAAVAYAEDGDEIVVMRGTYVEAVLIDKDIRLSGDGPVADVILVAPDDGPTTPLQEGMINSDPYALLLRGTTATVSGLTFEGLRSEVILDGGVPTLRDSVFTGVGISFDGSSLAPNGSSVVVTNGAAAQILGNEIRGGGPIGIFGDADATIATNSLTGGPHLYLLDYGSEVVIDGNTIDGTLKWAIGAFDGDLSGHIVIENNTLSNPGEMGIKISEGSAEVLRNTVDGASMTGVIVGLQPVSIIGNTFSHNRIAISASSGDGPIADNIIRGGTAGIVVARDREVTGNDIEGVEARGITISSGSPVLRENRACGNGQNLWVSDNADPDIDASNEICAEPVTA